MKTRNQKPHVKHALLWQILTTDKHLRAIARELVKMSQSGKTGVFIRCSEAEMRSVSCSTSMNRITALLDQIDKRHAFFKFELDWSKGLTLTSEDDSSLKQVNWVHTTLGELLATANN